MNAPRPTRVLVLRTSRFLSTAVSRVRRDWPDASLCVVHQAGTEAELETAGIAADARIPVPVGTRLTIGALLTSTWGWRALQWRPDAVVLQWWNPVGQGHEAADRAALLLQPRGFYAVLEDGQRLWVPGGRRLWRPVATLGRRLVGAALVVVVAVLAVTLWPATCWHQRRERRRLHRAV